MDKAASIRSAMLIGEAGVCALANSHVMLLGLGGVGSFAAEALARSGVGTLTLVDADDVSVSNRNRQLPALSSTVGRAKVDVMRERLLDVAPSLRLTCVRQFYLPDDPVAIPSDVDVVLDAIDTVSAKVHLLCACHARGLPAVSCMGMGNRLDPGGVRAGDLFDTSGCPLCRVMRRELRRRGVTRQRCVYSVEPARTPFSMEDGEKKGERPAPASMIFAPATAGLTLAWEAVRLLLTRAGVPITAETGATGGRCSD